jgi:hypothetical protein
MKIKVPKCIVGSLFAVAMLIVIWWWLSDPRMHQAKVVIDRLEAFQKDHGHLPDSLKEIGIASDESGPVYYQRHNDGSYIVWYGLSLGHSEVYDSRIRKWSQN